MIALSDSDFGIFSKILLSVLFGIFLIILRGILLSLFEYLAGIL